MVTEYLPPVNLKADHVAQRFVHLRVVGRRRHAVDFYLHGPHLFVKSGEVGRAHEVVRRRQGNGIGQGKVPEQPVFVVHRKSDVDLMRLSRLILDKGTEHAKALADFDVAAIDLAALRDALNQFKTEQAAPSVTRAEGAADTKEQARLYREAQAQLTDQLDRQVARYETKDAKFFAAYQSARKPNATATRYTKAAPTMLAAA